MNAALDASMDHLEMVVAERICARTGHATDHVNVRILLQQLKFADKTDCGFITAQHFHEFLWSMSVVGRTLAIDGEMLFNRYDEDLSGVVECREFALAVFGAGETKRFTQRTLELFHLFRGAVLRNGLAFLLAFLKRVSALANSDGFAPLRIVANVVSDELHGNLDIEFNELPTLLGVFDVQGKGNVNVTAFVKRFKSGMNSYRKKLVRAVFDHLDAERRGAVSVDALQCHYAVDPRERVFSAAFLADDAVSIHALLSHVLGNASKRRREHDNDDLVSWTDFLDFYRTLSLGVADDLQFDLVLRHSWHWSASLSPPQSRLSPLSPLSVACGGSSPRSTTTSGSGSGGSSCRDAASPLSPGSVRRRLLVTHANGSERVVEIVDELGRTKLNGPALHETLRSMGIRDVSDIRW